MVSIIISNIEVSNIDELGKGACGKRGIRTLGKQKAYIAVPMLRLEPLGHLSYIMIMPLNRVNCEAFIFHLRRGTQSIETNKKK